MRPNRLSLSLCLIAALSACGGGGSGGSGGGPPTGGGTPTPSPTTSPTPSPTPTGTACSLSERQDWALAQINEWYLFPELVASGVNKAAYNNLDNYIDALVAPARAQSRDRYFTYVTSIAAENALINSGATAGFGFRLGYDTGARRVFVIESFEGAPALGQNIDRGDEILGIGTSGGTIQNVSSLMASGGPAAVINALGPDTAGLTRVLRIQSLGGAQREVTLSKTNYSMDPVSPRYGARIIESGGERFGYLNLRTFIVSTAETQLKSAFQTFKNQGIDKVVVDLRYNGGGLVSMGLLLQDLMSANRANQISGYVSYRPSKSSNNETFRFQPPSQSIAAMKIAFIATSSSASASELVMNTFPPHLGNNVALIGSNTYGKPVGQIARDRSVCDDRLRVVAFKLENSDRQGEYYNGLATTMPVTCRASDNITYQLGDPSENMVATALSWLRGQSCTAITAKAPASADQRQLLQPERPSAAQHEIPGLF